MATAKQEEKAPKKKTEEKPADKKASAESKKTQKTTTEQSKEVVEKNKAVVATAKAGKRSKKAIEEQDSKMQKEARKASAEDDVAVIKVVQKPRVKVYSKAQKAARELIDFDKQYSLSDAIELLPKLSKVKFDPSAELHIRLDIDTKQADQNIRVSAPLPAGTGKTANVAVISGPKESEAAKAAGADNVDGDAILAALAKGKIDFEVLVCSPDRMSELGRHAKVLGPKGLMPSPKNGTVTNDPAKVVGEIKRGRVEIKNDAQGIVHVGFGKLSFKSSDLLANAKTVLHAVKTNKPSGVKGVYVRSIYVSSSMSPSIRIDTSDALK